MAHTQVIYGTVWLKLAHQGSARRPTGANTTPCPPRELQIAVRQLLFPNFCSDGCGSHPVLCGWPLSSGLMAAVRRLGGGGLDVGREMGELVCR
jgi:hypothetical protein